jgi:hypothetical protein
MPAPDRFDVVHNNRIIGVVYQCFVDTRFGFLAVRKWRYHKYASSFYLWEESFFLRRNAVAACIQRYGGEQ